MNREDISKKVGLNIRKLRLIKGISQEKLALHAGIHPAYLGRLERGEKCPTVETIFKISEALEIDASEILLFESKTEQKTMKEDARIKVVMNKLPMEKQEKIVDIIENIAKLIEK